MTRLILALTLLASPALACGPEDCGPPPEPPKPPAVTIIPDDNDPGMPTPPLALPCSILPSGNVEFKAPLPTDASKAQTRLICETALREGAKLRRATRQGVKG